MTFTENEILRQMKANHCTRDEAIEILQWDYEIDHGNKENGALTKEQKALVRKITKADKAPNVKRTVKRERKVDEDKKTIFGWLKTLMEGFQGNETISNLSCKNETEISFTYNGNAYTLKLTKHREKKSEK